MQAGDIAWYVLEERLGDEFAKQFASRSSATDQLRFYGEFILTPNANVGDLAMAYGLKVDEEERQLSLGQLFRRHFGNMPVAGDRINLNGFEITVKELDDLCHIQSLGLKIPRSQE